MRRLKWILPILVIIAAVFLSRGIKHSRPVAPVTASVTKLANVRIIRAQQTSYQPQIISQGTVRPKRAIELVPEVAGKIVWVSPSFTNGGSYDKNEVLVRIDPSNYQFAIERARANVADAEAKLALEVAEGEIARQDWEDISNGRAATDLALRKPQLAGAQAKLGSANADLHKAELDLSRTKISAPFKGRVDVKRSDIGQYVSLGTNLADLYSTDIAEIFLPLTDKQLAKINLQATYGKAGAKAQPLAILLSAEVSGKLRNWQGHIVRTAGAIDQTSRVLNVIVEVKNPYSVTKNGAPLLNGSFVKAEIPGVLINDVISVPRSALRNQSQLVIVDDENKMWSRPIEIMHSGPKNILVRGISNGARVVISPLDMLIEGTEVTVQEDNWAAQ